MFTFESQLTKATGNDLQQGNVSKKKSIWRKIRFDSTRMMGMNTTQICFSLYAGTTKNTPNEQNTKTTSTWHFLSILKKLLETFVSWKSKATAVPSLF